MYTQLAEQIYHTPVGVPFSFQLQEWGHTKNTTYCFAGVHADVPITLMPEIEAETIFAGYNLLYETLLQCRIPMLPAYFDSRLEGSGKVPGQFICLHHRTQSVKALRTILELSSDWSSFSCTLPIRPRTWLKSLRTASILIRSSPKIFQISSEDPEVLYVTWAYGMMARLEAI